MRHLLAVIAFSCLLAGCSTLRIDAPATPRALDPLRDDVASATFAVDLPRGLAPAEAGPTFALDVVVPGKGEQHLAAVLVRADDDGAVATLPSPASGRAYYLFSLADTDQPMVRAALAWGRGQGARSSDVKLSLTPRLCQSGEAAGGSSTASILVALPGGGPLLPLADRVAVPTLTGSNRLPACR